MPSLTQALGRQYLGRARVSAALMRTAQKTGQLRKRRQQKAWWRAVPREAEVLPAEMVPRSRMIRSATVMARTRSETKKVHLNYLSRILTSPQRRRKDCHIMRQSISTIRLAVMMLTATMAMAMPWLQAPAPSSTKEETTMSASSTTKKRMSLKETLPTLVWLNCIQVNMSDKVDSESTKFDSELVEYQFEVDLDFSSDLRITVCSGRAQVRRSGEELLLLLEALGCPSAIHLLLCAELVLEPTQHVAACQSLLQQLLAKINEEDCPPQQCQLITNFLVKSEFLKPKAPEVMPQADPQAEASLFQRINYGLGSAISKFSIHQEIDKFKAFIKYKTLQLENDPFAQLDSKLSSTVTVLERAGKFLDARSSQLSIWRDQAQNYPYDTFANKVLAMHESVVGLQWRAKSLLVGIKRRREQVRTQVEQERKWQFQSKAWVQSCRDLLEKSKRRQKFQSGLVQSQWRLRTLRLVLQSVVRVSEEQLGRVLSKLERLVIETCQL